MTTATTTGNRVNTTDNILICFMLNRDRINRIQGMAIDTTAIQNNSITKLDKDRVDPTPKMARGNHAATPVNGYVKSHHVVR